MKKCEFTGILGLGTLVLGIWLAGCASPADNQIYDQLLDRDYQGYRLVPVGLCEDYPEETTTLEIIRRDLELLQRNDIRLLRISFGWDGIETARDQYDWGFWDEFVRLAVDEYGITLIPYVCYTPRWNSTGDSLDFWNHPPVDYEEFGEFMRDLVSRYKDRIHSWELWNEPDISAFWAGDAEQLARLVKIGSQAVREIDPRAIVVLGGLAWKVDFLEELFREHNLSPHVDVVNIHNYFETWHPSPVEEITSYVEQMQAVIDSFGNHQPLWMAEVGYSTWRVGPKVSDHYQAYYEYEHGFDYQAVQLFKTLTLLYAGGQVDAIAWYEIKDLPAAEGVIGDNNNRNLGVARIDHTPKPAEAALRFFNRLMGRKYRCISPDIRLPDQSHPDLVVQAFELQDGAVIVVSWLRTTVYEWRGADRSGLVKDTRSVTLDLELPFPVRSAQVFDCLGTETAGRPLIHNSGPDKSRLTGPVVGGGEIKILKLTR